MRIIKIGGGLVAPKNRKKVVDSIVLHDLCQALSLSDEQMIIIHGAGSFGHPAAKKYAIHKGFQDSSQKEGLLEIREDVDNLNNMIVHELKNAGIPAISFQPSSLFVCSGSRIVFCNLEPLKSCLELGLTPVLYGDVVFDRKSKFCILSGDQILGYLFRELGIREAVFLSDVDGVLRDGDVVESIKTTDNISFAKETGDVTGGMLGKLKEIQEYEVKGWLINGKKPERIRDLMKLGETLGTRFV